MQSYHNIDGFYKVVKFKYRSLYGNSDNRLKRRKDTSTHFPAVFMSLCVVALITLGIFLPVISYSQSSDFSNISLKNQVVYTKLKTSMEPSSSSIAIRESSNTAAARNLIGTDKVVILSFDDNRKGDITYAKPILDKYGFKATFFVICGKTTDRGAMNWNDLATMKQDGMDIESHTMTHAHLDNLTQSQLEFEVGGSKQCLANHGYNATIFAYPYNEGANNPNVVKTVAKYYDLARTGTEPLMFLNCQGFKGDSQTDCRTYTSDGKLTHANRYLIRSLSFDVNEINDAFDNATIYSDFVKLVNSQNSYNQNGKINAVPLITFHNVALTTNHRYYTNAGLFDELMKYLHDNGFRVLTLKQIGYDTQSNTFYLK
jgi:peptidoglycan/xylan/chitin deacetylase (PgdA/CDA1 family)